MEFHETPVAGVYLVRQQRCTDERGYFARVWCAQQFRDQGLEPNVCQCNVGFSRKSGTLRGIHFQQPPHAEVKLVRCTAGAIYDVALDLRPESPTFLEWYGVELNPIEGQMLYIPEGCAHGYQTLADDTEILYQTSKAYVSDAASGVRYDDPAFEIQWPLCPTMISEADRNWPAFSSVADRQSSSRERLR